MAAEETELRAQNPGLSQDQIAFEGNEAGRAATVATVEQLTGVHIDHFAEINLDGFYELAKVLGGVEVCLNHPVPYDPNSGFSAARAGYQHLNAKMALAFVRQRDGLTNGDLDRTHRQQAFLDSVMHQLRTEGVLDDLTKIQALLSVAKQYVITDAGWNLLDFVAQMRSLTSGNLTFRTLPIVGYQTIDGQDANVVNPSYIQQIVQETFYPAPRSSASPEPLGPVHGGRQPGHGGRLQRRQHPGPGRSRSRPPWSRTGTRPARSANTSPLTTTEVLYGAGTSANASKIASLFNVTATASSTVAAGHVEILLGADATLPSSAATSSPRPRRRSFGGADPVHRRAGRRGQRQERHSLRQLSWRHGEDQGDRREGRARRP